MKDYCLTEIFFQVEDVLRITDAGADWQVDTLLKEACSAVVETACKNRDLNPTGVISCLMEKLVTTRKLFIQLQL